MNKFYITTAIDYPNALPHLGTSYEKIGADVIARFMRLAGCDVYFQMGNDEHSQNVKKKAEEMSKEPKEYCDEMKIVFEKNWKTLDISYDYFIQTSTDAHAKVVQDILSRIHKNEEIYQSEYEGYYCVSCEAFVQEKDLVEGNCPNHGKKPDWIKEKNYFFKLSKYTKKLIEHIEKNKEFIRPETRRNEVLSFLKSKEGLEDVSISRQKSEWGVTLPFDENEVCYVWFDALINYVSGLGKIDGDKYKKYWPADLHIIGKDIIRFHCIIWPAILMSAKLPLPKTVWAHGFVNFKGEKMSKTKGIIISPEEITKKYSSDAVRYFLMREVMWDKDGDFSEERLVERYNSDLANDFGNLVNRVTMMCDKYEKISFSKTENLHAKKIKKTKEKFLKLMKEYALSESLACVWELISFANTEINNSKPWELAKNKKDKELSQVLYSLCESLKALALMLAPYMPNKCEKLWGFLGIEKKLGEARFGDIEKEAKFSIKKSEPLFPRME